MQNGFTKIKSHFDDQMTFLAENFFFQTEVDTQNLPQLSVTCGLLLRKRKVALEEVN